VLVHPPAVTTQPLGDVLGRIIERGVGIRRLAFATQRQAAAGMQVYVAGKEAARATECDLCLQGMVEILAGNDIEVIRHAGSQRIRQIHLFA
jgi:hypothetical protein